MKGGEGKASMPLGQLILLGIMAGAFVAFGGAASSTAAHAVENVGLARTLTGVIFPVGLMMIAFIGGELFTGNCLIMMNVLAGKVTLKQFIKCMLVVYFSNLAGALIIDVLVFFSGNLDYSDGLLGAYTIKTALGKIAISPVKGITSGILCNILVCVAILMAGAARDISGKVWAIFFPIWAFVIAGFEHCIANMFYIPLGIMAASVPKYAARAMEAYGITAQELEGLTVWRSLNNFIPVTAGNMIGGALCVGGMFYLIHKRDWSKWKE